LLIAAKHDNVTKVIRPSFPAPSTEYDPRWGWWGGWERGQRSTSDKIS